jgi:hypothetical protein
MAKYSPETAFDDRNQEPELNTDSLIEQVDLRLQDFFRNSLELVQNTALVNSRIKAGGFDDYIIYKPAKMYPVPSPDAIISNGVHLDNIFRSADKQIPPNIEVGNDFFRIFRLGSINGGPISREELLMMQAGTYTPPATAARIWIKSAFTRMHTISELNEFTEDLVINMSIGNPRSQKEIYRQELFVAYHLMANGLVCETDPDVKRADGSINVHYLTHTH